MENSKPSTSGKQKINKVCKSCSKSFDESRILKHIIHSSCKNDYTKEEIDILRNLADERRKRKRNEQRHKNRENKIKSDILVLSEVCRSCQKTFSETSILKHITQTECMMNYDDDEIGFLRHCAEERKKDLETDYWTENKESLIQKRKEKLETEKKSKQGLLEMCKSCKKKMGDRSILKHLSQTESCKKDYNENDMEYLRNWADKRNKAKKSNYYTINKASIISKKSVRYKQKKEEEKEELRRKWIERDKQNFEKSKESYERNARCYNGIDYEIAKRNFPRVFAELRTYSLSEEDSKTVLSFENSIEETYKKFESEIDRVANLAKDLKYENNWYAVLDDFYSTTNNDRSSKMAEEWHQLTLRIDLSLKDIATKMERPYVWAKSCHCEKCLNAKKIKGKGKGKKSKTKEES